MSIDLDEQARSILSKNDRGGYTIPTARLYPYQWNWDSAFIALGLATYDRERAWTELELLLEGQWENGMIPSIIFRDNDPDYFPGPSTWQTQTAMQTPPAIASTGISQPPVLASIVLELVESGSDDDLHRAAALIDRILKWHQWYERERTPDNTSVVATVHPWETGRDNCPDWELGLSTMSIDPELEAYVRKDIEHANPAQRPSQEQYDKYLTIVKYGRQIAWDQTRLTNSGPFVMADPGIHFILLRANRDLLKLTQKLNLAEQSKQLELLIAKGVQGCDYFWNDAVGAYTARNVVNGEYSNGFTNASALCFYADVGNQDQRARTIKNMQRISTQVKFMMPSWDPEADKFDPQRYWCGPIWPQMNYIISQGLTEQNYSSMATDIRRDLMLLIEQSGFYECFNPITGEGCIGSDFSWTAAIWLAWASPNKQRIAA